MNSEVRVSVVVIFLNGQPYLAEAIDSILAQTFRALELILVDDGSTDGSSDLARQYAARDPDRIRYIEHEGHANLGMSASRNAGIALARGEYVAFNDADDVWHANKLADQVAIADANPTVGMVAGGANYWESWCGGTDVVVIPGGTVDTVIAPPEALLAIYPIGSAEAACPSTLLCRKSALDAIGGFEESFRGMYEDQAFLSKMHLSAPVYYPNQCWLDYRQHENSCSSEIAREGTMTRVRTHYFAWLRDYMSRTGVTDARVWQALDNAERKHRRTVLLRSVTHGRVATAIRKMVRRVKRRVVD